GCRRYGPWRLPGRPDRTGARGPSAHRNGHPSSHSSGYSRTPVSWPRRRVGYSWPPGRCRPAPGPPPKPAVQTKKLSSWFLYCFYKTVEACVERFAPTTNLKPTNPPEIPSPLVTNLSHHHFMTLTAQAGDALFNRVARLQILGRFHAQAHAGRSARDDERARMQGHELAEVAHQIAGRENHVSRIAVLARLPVDGKAQFEIGNVGNFVGGGDPGADRGEIVEAFPLAPLAAAIHLPIALRDIVHPAVAGNGGQCGLFVHPRNPTADHYAQLHFPVGMGAAGRHENGVVRTADRRRRHVEHDGFGGNGQIRFQGVIA